MKRLTKNSKLILLTVATFACLLMAVLGLTSVSAKANELVAPTLTTFTMTEGASVRMGEADGKNGIRYEASMSNEDYATLKNSEDFDVTFGMLVTFDEYAQQKPLNVEANVFGENAFYTTTGEADKAPIRDMTALNLWESEGKMKIRGSIVGIKDANIARTYSAMAYVKLVDKTNADNVEYIFATADDNTRSIAYVAQKAIAYTGANELIADQKTWLQTNYVDKVNTVDTDYVVKHYKQNLADDEYTYFEQETLTGKIDVAAPYAEKEYVGFTAIENNARPKLLADDKSEIIAYYDRNVYTVTFNTGDGSAVEAQQVKYEGKATEPTAPTLANNDFDGWELNSATYDFNTAVTGAITLTAKWVDIAGLATEKTGSLYKGELYYFDKQATGDYAVTLPESLGEITKVYLAGSKVTATTAGSVVTIDGDSVRALASGETKLYLQAGGSWYGYDVTIADYVVSQASELQPAMQAAKTAKKYVVLSANITAGDYAITDGTATWNSAWLSTFDGKGNVIDGLNITSGSFLGTYVTGASATEIGVLKNVAFTNVTAGNFLGTYVQNFKIENVFISGTVTTIIERFYYQNLTGIVTNMAVSIKNASGTQLDNIGVGWLSYGDYTLRESANTTTGKLSISNLQIDTGTGFIESEITPFGAPWELKTDGLYFNGNRVMIDAEGLLASATAKTGSLYKGELYYFDKQATGDYEIALPENLGTISKAMIGDSEVAVTYTSDGNKITLNGDSVRAITAGETNLLVFTGSAWYSYKVTIADQIIDSVSDFDTAMTKPSGYMIITTNLSDATSNNNSNTNGACSFTLDGKGHTITGLTIAANGLGGGLSTNQWTLSSFTIKNLAMSGIKGVDGAVPSKVLAECATGVTLENVYFEGLGNGMGTMFNSKASSIKDVVVFLAHSTGRLSSFGTLYNTGWASLGTITTETVDNFTVENVHYQTNNATSFFSSYTNTDSLPAAFNSEWTIETDGLYFNGTKILAK